MSLGHRQAELQAPSIDVLAKSIKLAWISRLLADKYKSGKSWKAILDYIFEIHCGLNFILQYHAIRQKSS